MRRTLFSTGSVFHASSGGSNEIIMQSRSSSTSHTREGKAGVKAKENQTGSPVFIPSHIDTSVCVVYRDLLTQKLNQKKRVFQFDEDGRNRVQYYMYK